MSLIRFVQHHIYTIIGDNSILQSSKFNAMDIFYGYFFSPTPNKIMRRIILV